MIITNKKKRFLWILFAFITSVSLLFAKKIPLKGLEEMPLWFINTDREGNIYAASLDEHTIYKLSSEGEVLFQIGRKGDIKRLTRFELNPMDGKLYVPELPGGNKRISIFNKMDGKYLGQYNLDLDWNNWSGLLKIKFDLSGNAYVDAIKTKFIEERDYIWIRWERHILKFSPEGRYLGLIWRAEEEVQISALGKPSQGIPFRNYLNWDLWRDMIIVGESYNNSIILLDTSGKILKNISMHFKQKELKKKDIENWKKWQKRNDIRIKKKIISPTSLDFLFERMKFPQYKPFISGLEFDKRGNAIIFKFTDYGKEKREWVKMSLETGKEIKRIVTSDEFLFIDEKFVYISRKLSEEKSQYFKIIREEYGF